MSQQQPPAIPINAIDKPVFVIRINVMASGKLEVNGFPAEYNQAMNAMGLAQRVVMDFFMSKAVKGEFREQKLFMPNQEQISKITRN
jgi:hypothetical protein